MTDLPYDVVHSHIRAGRYPEALATAQAWANESYSALAYTTLGHVYLMMQLPELALTALHCALDAEPAAPSLWFQRARVHFRLKDFTAALADSQACLAECIRTQDNDYLDTARVLAAACLVELGEPETALEELAAARMDCVVHAGRLLTVERLRAAALARA